MSTRRDNHGPVGFDESALLDLVESEADLAGLPPDVQARIGRLRADRGVLCGLGELRAPAGLIAAAQRTAERRALLEMEGAAEARLAVSTVRRPRTPSLLETIFADRFARRFATAAVLAIVAGAVVLVLSRSGVKNGSPAPGPVAAGGPSEISGPAVPDAATAALATDSAPEPEPAIAALAGTADQPESAAPAPMALSRAVALAREGRLGLRIRAADTEKAELRLDRLAFRGRAEEGWRVAGLLPEGAAITLRYVTPAAPRPEGPPAMADDGLGAPPRTVEVPPAPPIAVPARPAGAVYVAEVRLDEPSLASLLAECGELSGQEAWFDELDSPSAPEPVMALDAVVWWGLPASAWEAWGRVPVSVERP